MYYSAVFKMDNQEGPTVEHRELCSVSCGSQDEAGVWERWIHVYVCLGPLVVHLKLLGC